MATGFSLLVRRDGSVLKATGGTQEALGRDPDELIGYSVFLMVPKRVHDRVRALLLAENGPPAGTVEDIPVIHNRKGAVQACVRTTPSGRSAVWMDFSSDGRAVPLRRAVLADGPEGAAVAEKEAFLETVAERINKFPDADHDLTMFEFSGLLGDGLGGDAAGDDAAAGVRSVVETTLSRWAVDGEVAHLKPGCYAILHPSRVVADDIVAEIPRSMKRHGLDDQDLGAKIETIRLDVKNTPQEDVKGTLSRIIDRFVKGAGSLFRKSRLLSTFSRVVPQLNDPAGLVRRALDREDVALAERAVVNVASGSQVLTLVRGQLRLDGGDAWIGDLIDLNGHPDLCVRHDLLVMKRVLAKLPIEADASPVIVELTRPSIVDAAFSGAVKEAVAAAAVPRAKLGFKPLGLSLSDTYSGAFRQFCEDLGSGHPVWVSHFPAAISSMRQLTTLWTEYVEVPLGLLKSISRQDDSPSLGRLIKVWRNVAMHVVITGLNDPQSAMLAREAGADYGVGAIYEV